MLHFLYVSPLDIKLQRVRRRHSSIGAELNDSALLRPFKRRKCFSQKLNHGTDALKSHGKFKNKTNNVSMLLTSLVGVEITSAEVLSKFGAKYLICWLY